jgi:hypothetical protein
LRWIPEEVRDYEMCWQAVEQNGLALQHVPQKFKTKEIIQSSWKHEDLTEWEEELPNTMTADIQQKPSNGISKIIGRFKSLFQVF